MDNSEEKSFEYEEAQDSSAIVFDDEAEENAMPDATPIFFGEEETGRKPEKKPAKKKVNAGKIAYLIFVLILILAIAGGLVWVWKQCEIYQENSAATVVRQAQEELSEATGLEFETSMIPTASEDGTFDYVLKSGGKPVAKVTLRKTGSGLLGLALFEKAGVSSLMHYKVVMPADCVLYAPDTGADYMSSAEDYVIVPLQNLKNAGFPVRTWKKVDVDWLYDASQLTVQRNGEIMPLIDLGNDTFLAVDYYTGGEKQAIREAAAELSNKYALFMSNDLGYWSLDPSIISGSPIRDLLMGMDMTWFGYHYYTEVNDLMMSDPVITGSGYAMINVSFNYDVIRWDGTDRSPIDLCLVLYLCDDGVWRLADLENNIKIELPMSEQTPWS